MSPDSHRAEYTAHMTTDSVAVFVWVQAMAAQFQIDRTLGEVHFVGNILHITLTTLQGAFEKCPFCLFDKKVFVVLPSLIEWICD